MNDSYRRLNIDDILDYTEVLSQRIRERFPKRGLAPVSQDLLLIAKNTQARIAWITRPITYLRVAIGVVVLIMALFVVSGLTNITVRFEDATLVYIVTLIEAGIQDLIFWGLGFIFWSVSRIG